MSSVIRYAMRGLAILLLLLLGACGGGGGGGSSTSIKVSPQALNFSANHNASLPASQRVSVSYSGDGLIVGYPPGAADASWLGVIQTGDGNPAQFNVAPIIANLPVGTYTATLRFVTGHADGSNVKFADVAVTYVVSVPFAASTSDAIFEQVAGETSAVTTQTISITKADSNFSVAADQPWLHAVAHGTESGGTVDISVDSTGLAQGAYNGVVTVTDTSEGHSPILLSVSLIIRNPNLNPDRNTLALAGVSDQTSPASATLSLSSETTRQVTFTEETTYGAAASNWLQAVAGGTTPATRQVTSSTTALPAGIYTATLHFVPANGAPAVDIPVTYTLRAASLGVSSSSLSFLVDANTASAALSQMLTLSDDGAPMTWSANTDVSWLKLNRTAGDTRSTNSLMVSIPTDQISQLQNGMYSGSVTIRYRSPSIAERVQVIPISLSLALPEIREVIPAFTSTNTGLAHVLRGQGFASIKTQKAHVGGQSLDVTVLSDDLVRVTLPALSANTYSISIDNTLGLTRSTGVVTAKNVPQYPAIDLPRNYQANRVLYDEGRQAIYSLDIDLNNPSSSTSTVRRYSYSGGSWQGSIVISFPDIYDIALSADGNTMFMAIDDKIYTLDLTNSSANIVQIGGLSNNAGNYWISQITLLADGKMLVIGAADEVFLFDPKKASFTGLYVGATCGKTGSSDDRTRVLVVENCVTPSQPVRAYNVVTATLAAIGYSTDGTQYRISLGRSGVLQAIDDKVFDQNSNLLASIGIYSSGIAFSPNSKRLYSLNVPSDGSAHALQVFDTSGSPVSGHYPMLTSYAVPNDFYRAYLNISLDGRTALLVANTHFLVIPLSN